MIYRICIACLHLLQLIYEIPFSKIFDLSEILQADWLSLPKDLSEYGDFDAVVCMGNSLIHLIDSPPEMALYRKCLENFRAMMKPGGTVLFDHRNMDVVLDTGTPINKNVYFKVSTTMRLMSL